MSLRQKKKKKKFHQMDKFFVKSLFIEYLLVLITEFPDPSGENSPSNVIPFSDKLPPFFISKSDFFSKKIVGLVSGEDLKLRGC